MTVQRQPGQYHTVTPYLVIDEAARAIDFYQQAFGAREAMRLPGPGGKVMHCELRIGDSALMLADEVPGMGLRSPRSYGGTPVSLMVYMDDVDTAFARALAAGAKEVRPVQDQFYGDRTGTLVDPFGHQWTLATHVEDVPAEEMNRRFAEMMGQPGEG